MTDLKSFYDRRDWIELRYRVLRKYGWKCMACGATKASGAQIHVDHIKPIKLFPDLALREDNLQVLCKPCNFGKSASYMDDFRPKPTTCVVAPRPKEEHEYAAMTDQIKSDLQTAERLGDLKKQAELMGQFLEKMRALAFLRSLRAGSRV